MTECTGLDVVTEHGGFAWFDVESRGVEAAGDDTERGVDGIALLAPVLAGIAALDAELARAIRRPPTAAAASTPPPSPAATSTPCTRRAASSAWSAA